MDDGRITDHFTWDEAICHDGTPVPELLRPNARKLASQLEIVRAAWAKLIAPDSPALIPICWYRTPAHNENLRIAALASGRMPGTAINSEHMRAAAIDVRPVRLGDLPRFRDLIQGLLTAKALPLIGGWAYYPGQWIHLDVRPKPSSGHVATWVGKGIASEMA
jgi:hypothetical protein